MKVDAMTSAVALASLAASGLNLPSLPAFAPAPATPEALARRSLVDGALAGAWRGLDGHCTDDAEDAAIDAVAGAFGSTYGEATPDGARCIFDALGLYGDAEGLVFADLGAGVGKMVAHASLETAVGRAIGVELSESRHAVSLEALARLKASGDADALRPSLDVDLRCGDILEDVPADATHAYCASLLFDDAFRRDLGAALDASRVEVFAALNDVPTASFIRDAQVRRARMTWNPATGATDFFVYRRRRPLGKL